LLSKEGRILNIRGEEEERSGGGGWETT